MGGGGVLMGERGGGAGEGWMGGAGERGWERRGGGWRKGCGFVL